MNFKQVIQDYFTFSRNERKGVILLLVIIFVLAVANKVIFYFETPATIDPHLIAVPLDGNQPSDDAAPGLVQHAVLFRFDPNTIDREALDSLALPDGIKRNVLKYREKGGVYYAGKDFRKMYGMTDSIYNKVSPYLVFAKAEGEFEKRFEKGFEGKFEKGFEKKFENGVEKKFEEREEVEVEIARIEINLSDSIELMTLPGIGDKLSKRIVKYRDLLGGFYSIAQLNEVYGLSGQVIEQCERRIKVDPTKIRKVDLNFADWVELARHPYIQKNAAQQIIKFRTRYGSINEPSILRDSMVLSQEEYVRLLPYL